MARSKQATIEAANSVLIEKGNIVRAHRRAFSEIEMEVEILVTSKDRIAWQ